MRSAVAGWLISQAGCGGAPALPVSAPSLAKSDFCGPVPIPAFTRSAEAHSSASNSSLRESRAAISAISADAAQRPMPPGRNRPRTEASATLIAFCPEKSIIRRREWLSATWPSSWAMTLAISSAVTRPSR